MGGPRDIYLGARLLLSSAFSRLLFGAGRLLFGRLPLSSSLLLAFSLPLPSLSFPCFSFCFCLLVVGPPKQFWQLNLPR